VRLVLIGLPPAYIEGLVQVAGDQGFDVESPVDVRSLAKQATHEEPLAIIMFYRGKEGHELIRTLSTNRWVSVLALVEGLDADAWLEAATAGAAGLAEWTSPPESIIGVLTAATHGELRLPIELYRIQVGRIPEQLTQPALAPSEVRWLHGLTTGMSIRALSEAEGMSVRTLQRRMHNLFLRIGALNREQAIARAVAWGLAEATADDDDSDPAS
jgi:DNA-binding NarL/FixJ family response regulator